MPDEFTTPPAAARLTIYLDGSEPLTIDADATQIRETRDAIRLAIEDRLLTFMIGTGGSGRLRVEQTIVLGRVVTMRFEEHSPVYRFDPDDFRPAAKGA